MDEKSSLLPRNNNNQHRLKFQWESFFDRGLFGIFLILWILTMTYLLYLSSTNYNSFESSVFQNYLSYETFENKTTVGGPYRVFKSTIYIGGFVCGRNQNAFVYYPSGSGSSSGFDDRKHSSQQQQRQQKFPLISFAHGFHAGGKQLDRFYSQLLVGLASWGFIVVAPESAPNNYCQEQYQDQLRIFEFLEQNKKKYRALASLDPTTYYGLLGHSMGGRSSIISATKKDEYNIGAAAALNPVYTQAVTHVQIPILFGTGTDDIFVPPGTVKVSYDETPEIIEKIYINILDGTHNEPGKHGQNYWPDYLAAFFTCHLYYNFTSSTHHQFTTPTLDTMVVTRIMNACHRVYGFNQKTCDMCSCQQKLPIESCKTNVMMTNER